MDDYAKVSVAELMKQYGLKTVSGGIDCNNVFITKPDINRPALQLAGFFEHFDEERVQIIGKVEHAFVETLDLKTRRDIFERFFAHRMPCVVLCRGLAPFSDMLELAAANNVPVLFTEDGTTDFVGDVIRWLKVQLAPSVSIHGVFVDIYGEGVLITGESGIGKSETALELIKRGHRLVADDAVEIKKVSNQTLIGTCPEILRYFIELRGIGIIDVRQMFGVQSVKATQNVDLVIKLEHWDKTKEYDRLGLVEEYTEILGISAVCHSIPIRPGRNLAVICESAAINNRQKRMGYNAARILSERISTNIAKNKAAQN